MHVKLFLLTFHTKWENQTNKAKINFQPMQALFKHYFINLKITQCNEMFKYLQEE